MIGDNLRSNTSKYWQLFTNVSAGTEKSLKIFMNSRMLVVWKLCSVLFDAINLSIFIFLSSIHFRRAFCYAKSSPASTTVGNEFIGRGKKYIYSHTHTYIHQHNKHWQKNFWKTRFEILVFSSLFVFNQFLWNQFRIENVTFFSKPNKNNVLKTFKTVSNDHQCLRF